MNVLSKFALSKIAFGSHIFGIIFVNSAWIWNYKILFLHLIVALSWYLNNNKCIISQIEYKLFNKTFIGDGEKYMFQEYIAICYILLEVFIFI